MSAPLFTVALDPGTIAALAAQIAKVQQQQGNKLMQAIDLPKPYLPFPLLHLLGDA